MNLYEEERLAALEARHNQLCQLMSKTCKLLADHQEKLLLHLQTVEARLKALEQAQNPI